MLERILQFSISHRYLVVVLTLAAGALGIYSFQRLPIDAVPDITANEVIINTVAPAMSPEQIEKQVTFPIESALAGIPGLQLTRSESRNGFSQITAVFDDSVNVYFARQQVSERLLEARRGLPPGAEPAMGSVTTGLSGVYLWALDYEHPMGHGANKVDGRPGWQTDGSYLTPEGERLENELVQLTYLRTVQDWIVRPQIKQVKDVADVDVQGGYVKQYQIQPDPMKLVAYGLTFRDLTDALEKNNVAIGAGYVEHNGETNIVRVSGRIENMDEIRQIVLRQRGGTPVRIKDVADVVIGGELRPGAATADGHESVSGTALMLIGANSRTVAAAVADKMRQIALPPDIRARSVLNRTKLVDSTIHTVAENLGLGAILVVIVLLALLGNFRAAIITALAIPIAMLLTASGMVESKISGNLMSLGAIDFGLIIDGAVIIVENCLRLIGQRQHDLGRPLTTAERLDVVLHASKQVLRPAVFGAAIIIIVYLPILTLQGIEGKMFWPMAMTVVLALVAAFLLSLTSVPAMVAICMRGRVAERENPLVRWAKRLYAPVVRLAIHQRWAVVAASVLIFAGSLWLFTRLGQTFIPRLDEGDIDVMCTRVPSTSLSESVRMQEATEEALRKFPEVEFVVSNIGTGDEATDPMPYSQSDTFVEMKSPSQWSDPKEAKEHLVQRMREALDKLPGSKYEFTQPVEDRFNDLTVGVKSDIAVDVFGEDFDQMLPAAKRIAEALNTVRGAKDVQVEQITGLPVMDLTPNVAAASRYGLDKAQISDVIAAAIGGREAGVVYEGDRHFDLVVRLPEAMRQDPRAIASLPVPIPREASVPEPARLASASGLALDVGPPGFVPLSSVATITVADGMNQIRRTNGKRHATILCNVRGRDLGSFVAEAQQKVAPIVKDLPPGNWVSWGGQFQNLTSARVRLMVVVPVSLLLIFGLLFATFGSARYAVLVFTGVPLALTGGIVALWVRQMPFSISAAVGFIALSGVAVLNGLVMVTFINELRRDGIPLEQAIIRGSLTRLRPVLMTALVASLGFVPMAIATGAGAEVQKPLATVVIGGILSSTFLTLLVLPALYRMWHREGRTVTDTRAEREAVLTGAGIES